LSTSIAPAEARPGSPASVVAAGGKRTPVSRDELLVLAVLLGVGIVLRAIFMVSPLRFDEVYTLQSYTTLTPRLIPLTYDLPNNHVLNTLLMRASVDAFGGGRWAIRLPALAAGIGAVPAAWWAARQIYTPEVGLWAAGLVAASSYLVDFSVNGRGYEIGVLLILLTLGLGARMLQTSSPWPARLLIVTGALAVWSVPTMAYGLAVVAAWMVASVALMRGGGATAWATRCARVAGVLALTLVLSAMLLLPLSVQRGWTYVGPLPHTWDAISGVARSSWSLWWRGAPRPLVWIIALASVASLLLHRRVARPGLRVPVGAAWIVALGGMLLSATKLGPLARSWIAMLPLFLIAAAAGLSGVAQLVTSRVALLQKVPAWTYVLLLTLVLAVRVAGTNPASSEAPPQSDNHLGQWLKQNRPGEQLLAEFISFGPNITHQLYLENYEVSVPRVTPRQLRAGRVLIVQARGLSDLAKAQVAQLGGPVTPAPVKVAKDFRYISVYEVAVKQPAAAGKGN